MSVGWLPFLGYDGVDSPRLFTGLLVAAAVLDLLVGVGVLAWGRGRPGSRRVLLAGLAVLGLYLPKAFVLRAGFHFRVWGLLNVLWYDLSVVLPTLSLLVLVTPRLRPRTRGAAVLAFVPLLWTPAALWARFVEPERLVVERVEVPLSRARAGSAPLRVAVLADLQAEEAGEHEREVFARLRALRPDVILLPGDLFQACKRRLDRVGPALRGLFASLEAPGGVYFVTGDVDDPWKVEALLDGTSVRILDDRIARVRVRDRAVTIVGLGGDSRRPVARALFAEVAADPSKDDVRLLLAHRPRVVRDVPPEARIDLVVAGHTHGGQVVLPFWGPPITLSPLPREVARGGLHRVAGTLLYVSRGVGMERKQAPRIRFLCPPELTLLRLGAEGPPPP